MAKSRIDEILATMDIPAMRRDTGDINNLRWLSRNVPMRNASHPQFRELMELLRVTLGGCCSLGE